MRTENSAGRMIGVLIILQMALGVMVNFVLEAPLFGQPGFLVNAAHYSRQLGVAVLLGLLTCGSELLSRRSHCSIGTAER